MSDSMSQLIKNAIGSGVRWVLVLVGGILVKKGIVSSDQSAAYVEQFTPVLIGAAMAGVALLWSLWQKKHQGEKVQKALDAPAGTSLAQLERK